MTLDPTETAMSPDDLIQYGRDEVIRRFAEVAYAADKCGDGRMLRSLTWMVEACGYRKPSRHIDDGA